MKLTVFQSTDGDCLLLTGADGKNMLVDGGRAGSFTLHVAPALSQLRQAKKKLDLVCVSHIDDDHISGIVQLLNDLMDWRVHKFKLKTNPSLKAPKSHEPPEIKKIWHNGFREIAADNSGKIEDMLSASANMLAMASDSGLLRFAAEQGLITPLQMRQIARSARRPENVARLRDLQLLANGEANALRLSRRISPRQLKIPLNPDFDQKLAMLRSTTKALKLGGMSLFVLAPTSAMLEKLRTEWNDWANEKKAQIRDIQKQADQDDKLLANSEVERLANAAALSAVKFGKRGGITPPNLASLMLLAEENSKSVLLTGDGHPDEILGGLKHYGKIADGSGLHVTALKVQHHGAIDNMTEAFARRITADHYIFCGNGASKNPEVEVVELLANSRIGSGQELSANPEAGNNFTMWFNSHSSLAADPDSKAAQQMKRVEKRVSELVASSGGRMAANFLKKGVPDVSKFHIAL